MSLHWDRPSSRFGFPLALGLAGAGALLVARFIPVAVLFHPVWGCTLRRLTGIPCPACGLTRAFDYTAHGRFLDAFRTTPLGAFLPWLCLVVAIYGAVSLVVRLPVPRLETTMREANSLRFGLAGLIALNWLYMVLTRPGAS